MSETSSRRRLAARLRAPLAVLLLAVLVALTGLGLWGTVLEEPHYGIGLDLDPYTPDPTAEATVSPDGTRRYETHAHLDIDSPYGELARAGLRDGEHVLAVGTVPLSDSTTSDERKAAEDQGRGAIGETVTVVVRRESGPHAVTVRRAARRVELARSIGLRYGALRTVSDVFQFLITLSAWISGLWLVSRARARGYLADLGLTLCAFGALMALTGGAGWVNERLPWFEVVVALLMMVCLPMFMRALARYPDGVVEGRWVPHLHWLPFVAFFGMFGLVMIVTVLAPLIGQDTAQRVSDSLAMLLVAGVLGAAAAGPAIALTLRYRRSTDREVRQQMKWVLVPLVVLTLTVVWVFGPEREMTALQSGASVGAFVLSLAANWTMKLAFVVLPLAIVAGALRFRPWDADLWIGRSVAVGAATLGLAAIFAGGSEALRVGLRTSMGEGADAVAAALAGVISVLVFNPTREWVQARAERGLRRTREILGDRLPLVLSGRQVVAPVAEIARVAIVGVCEALATDRAAVLLRRPGGWAVAGADGVPADAVLAWAETAAADPDGTLPAVPCQDWDDPTFVLRVPLRSAEGEAVGVLALGTHGAGRGYSTEERRALARMARPLAEALLVAERREAARDAEYARLARLVERVSGDGGAGDAAPAVSA